jgi:pyruvate/2-oxoglutarate dehydrogenase complex dihydrolipoamide dehydrogenase (E3) component
VRQYLPSTAADRLGVRVPGARSSLQWEAQGLMSVQRFDVVVIGGGPAGVTAALRARELGASVALVERGRPGGTCTNDGCVPTRVLARAARLAREARQLDEYGLVGAEPRVDMAAVMARVQEKVDAVHAKKDLLGHLERSGATALIGAGAARFVDGHTVQVGDATRLEADTFIICAGGHPRRLPFPGAELAITHSDVWGLRELPRAVAVVGAAATGCQLASIFRAFGSEVTLLDAAPRILAGEDEELSRTVASCFREGGIAVVEGIAGVSEITRRAGGLRLVYEREGRHEVDVDAVVLAVGWPGNVEGLGLEAAGVAVERGYIVTDDYLRTSRPHIFAAGDINGKMMLVQSGGYEARVAAENALAGDRERVAHTIVPHGGFTDPEYASVGPTEAQARELGEVLVATAPMDRIDRAVIDGRPDGFCKLIVRREDHTLLAAHVVGEQALEIVHVVAAGMASSMTVDALARLEVAYPTYTAVLSAAAQQIMRDLGGESTAQWRALGGLRASPL